MRLAVIRARYPVFIDFVYQLAELIAQLDPPLDVATLDARGMQCEGCGCDDEHACVQGMKDGKPIPCTWQAPFLCSFCAVRGYFEYLGATGRAV